MGIRICGTGAAVPDKVVTNDDLTAYMETSDEWITQRTGIRERRVLSGGETLLSLAVRAGEDALRDAGAERSEVDLLIVTTLIGDFKTPSLSCLLAGELGINCITLDINMACCGFVYGLNTACAYIGAGMAKKVLIVSAEALSRIADWKDRSTCVLFGDAAAAVVVEPGECDPTFILKVDGKDGWQHLYARRTSDNSPFGDPDYADNGFLHMNGQEIYKFAVSSVTGRLRELFDATGYTLDDMRAVLLHQANLRIIHGAASRFGTPEKFPHNVEHYGNTSSASVPLLLHEYAKELQRGDKIILCAFGAGLSSAACLLEW